MTSNLVVYWTDMSVLKGFSVSETYQPLVCCRGLLLEYRRPGYPRGDTGGRDAHSCTRPAWRSRWRWRRDGRHGGRRPSHSSSTVGDLHSTAICPHSAFLQRVLCLSHLVGGCLPGHKLSVWHLLPSVPYAKLRKMQCHSSVHAAQDTCRQPRGRFTTTQLQIDCTVFLVATEFLIKVGYCNIYRLVVLVTLWGQQDSGIKYTGSPGVCITKQVQLSLSVRQTLTRVKTNCELAQLNLGSLLQAPSYSCQGATRYRYWW